MIFRNRSSKGIFGQNMSDLPNGPLTGGSRSLQSAVLKDIMLSAGWSNERTFQQFYHKPSDPEFNFGQEILRTLAQK